MSDRRSEPLGRGELAALAVLFVASRLLYRAAGVHFDTGTLGFYWQYLDPRLLATDLWRSVLHLHSQPPLFNLFLGAILHLPGRWVHLAFHAFFAGCGLALGLALLALAARLGVPRWLRLPAAALFLASPAAVLHESLLFYSYPVMTALVLAALCLHRFLASGRRADGLAGCGLLAGVVLTQSLFHLMFLAFVAAGVALASRPLRRAALAAAALPILVVVLWYARSAALFGTFSSSSWLGMSAAKVATKLMPASERSVLAAEPAETILAVEPFSPLAAYAGVAGLPPLPPPTGVPALDEAVKSTGAPNLNHLAYVDLSRRYLAATRHLVRRDPRWYLRGAGAAWLVYLRSGADSAWLGDNRRRIAGFSRWFDRLVYLQLEPFTGQLGPSHVAWSIVLLLPLALVHGARLARRGWLAGDLAGAATVLFLIVTVLYVAVVGNSVELGENNRFRFETEPLALVLLLRWVSELARRRSAPPAPGLQS